MCHNDTGYARLADRRVYGEYAAMKRVGKQVEFVSIPMADHYFTREADRITLLTAIEVFLAKHNPAD